MRNEQIQVTKHEQQPCHSVRKGQNGLFYLISQYSAPWMYPQIRHLFHFILAVPILSPTGDSWGFLMFESTGTCYGESGEKICGGDRSCSFLAKSKFYLHCIFMKGARYDNYCRCTFQLVYEYDVEIKGKFLFSLVHVY